MLVSFIPIGVTTIQLIFLYKLLWPKSFNTNLFGITIDLHYVVLVHVVDVYGFSITKASVGHYLVLHFWYLDELALVSQPNIMYLWYCCSCCARGIHSKITHDL